MDIVKVYDRHRQHTFESVLLKPDNLEEALKWLDLPKGVLFGIVKSPEDERPIGIVVQAHDHHDEPMTAFVGDLLARSGEYISRVTPRYYRKNCEALIK